MRHQCILLRLCDILASMLAGILCLSESWLVWELSNLMGVRAKQAMTSSYEPASLRLDT